MREITTLPTGSAATNMVTGQLDTSTPMPSCRATVGGVNQKLAIRLKDAPSSSLRVDCPSAESLALENINGKCLQVVWASGSTIHTSGNRSIVIYPNPQRMRSTINVSGMTSWGVPPAPRRTPMNTRVILRLSQWVQDRSSASLMKVEGSVPYAVPDGAFAVVIYGCGASTVTCTVKDKDGKPSCRATDVCVPTAAAAKANALAAVNADNPCITPSPVVDG